jgi:actin-related protein 10
LVVGDEIVTCVTTAQKSMAADPPPASRRISTIIDSRPPTSRSSSSYVVGSTPHYSSTRRHSLYGTEDRIIIDPGSKYWKVGFSGEGKPRQVYEIVQAEDEPTLWSWHSSRSQEEYEEADRMLAARLQDALRAVFFE